MLVLKNVAFLLVNIQRRIHFYALTLWEKDSFKFVSSLVGLLYSLVTIFTRKKSLGHPVALLKANQIRFRSILERKEKKEKHYLCDLTFGLWYWPSRVILNNTGPLLYAQCTCVDHEEREMNLKSNNQKVNGQLPCGMKIKCTFRNDVIPQCNWPLTFWYWTSSSFLFLVHTCALCIK